MQSENESETSQRSQRSISSLIPADLPTSVVFNSTKNIIKIVVFIILIGTLVIVIIAENEEIEHTLYEFLAWINDNIVIGTIVFILIYIAAALLMIPVFILTIAAGYIYSKLYGVAWGIVIGCCVVFIGASLGAILAMLAGKYIFQECLQNYIANSPRLKAIEQAIQEEGAKICFLLRLCPLVPYNLLNYVLGCMDINFYYNVIALFAMIPHFVVYCYIGSALKSLTEAIKGDYQISELQIAMLIFGTLIAIVITVYVTCIVKKKLESLILVETMQLPQPEEIEPLREEEELENADDK